MTSEYNILKELCTSPYVRKNGDKVWWDKSHLHRADGLPAVERVNGDKEWWINGKLHRDNDLPAIDFVSGEKMWYVNGTLHRDTDLPAVINYRHMIWYKKIM